MSFDKSIQTLTLVWNEKRFVQSKSARNASRRSIFRAATILFNSELKILANQNDEIYHAINRCNSHLQKYDDKLQILDNMTQLATQSLEKYFQARMENLRTFVTEQCRIISDGIQEEVDHWKEIHAMLQQKLIVPGDLHSYGGGNGLPRAVKQSPNISQIVEEDEEKENDVSTLLQSRTLTPLITQTLKKARLLTSKLSQDASMIIPSQLNISTTIHQETLPISIVPENYVTLSNVSAIEMVHNIPDSELYVSLLPCIPTINSEKENNKSITSTISDKTFVKTSLHPFSSEEESNDDDMEDDDTVVEESLITDNIENVRPLLLTADRSIRRPPPLLQEEKHSLSNQPNIEKSKIKQEKVSFREPLYAVHDSSNKDTEKSDYNSKSCKSPIVEQISIKRRTTRRTTTRLLRENQNDSLPLQLPVELPAKTRYATRYSTRLATAIVSEEFTIPRTSTSRRRTIRFTSE